jgi:carbamoyltransferase
MSYWLGINCYAWHEAAAVLVRDGELIAAVEQERFTRKKYDSSFPAQAIDYCLQHAGVSANDITSIGCGFDLRRKRLRKGLHILRYPSSLRLVANRQAIFSKMRSIQRDLRDYLGYRGTIRNLGHHLCHAASAYYASPFDEATILTIDGVGDWESCWWGEGRGGTIRQHGAIYWPRSLGHIYATFTEYLGFQSFADEYKVMGLAAYGSPVYQREMARIFWPSASGYEVDLSYFGYHVGESPRFGKRLVDLFGPPLTREQSEQSTAQHYRDVAASLQAQLETVVFHLVRKAIDATGLRNLCLAGGVAMNCAANGKIVSEQLVDSLFVPPCASDAGVALGAAYVSEQLDTGAVPRHVLRSACVGPAYDVERVEAALRAAGLRLVRLEQPSRTAADLLAEGRVIGWFQGRMEFGQRALGCRSILADPRRAEMKDTLNAKIKFREPFRPFAPSVLEEHVAEFFDCAHASPFMTEVYLVRPDKRGVIPAVTHVDGTARVQSVSRTTHPRYWELIDCFRALTGVPVVLNTSLNIRGEPIVNTPEEAVATFLKTDLDALICEEFLAEKTPL